MKNEVSHRVQKLIADAGICSRRHAEKLIIDKKVTINGVIAKLGDKATISDLILVNGKVIQTDEKEYYLINKPKRFICTADDKQNRKILVSIINTDKRLFTVGRLDYNTTGAIIATNDGELTYKLTHPSFEIERVYNAQIDSLLTKQELAQLNQVMTINNKPSYQMVKWLGNNIYQVLLHQGSNHHVKKIFEHIGKQVVELHRISYSFLNVDNLPIGSYRQLKPFEIKKLKLLFRKQ